MQAGNVRFAPMQPFPPTKITATNTAPLNPTSSVVIATTFLKPPTIQTTITQTPTWVVTSKENQVRLLFLHGSWLTRLRWRYADATLLLGQSGTEPKGRYAEILEPVEGLI
jgi:hypothetical protein